MLLGSIDSWAWVSVNLPQVACGQTKRPGSSRLAAAAVTISGPSQVHQSSLMNDTAPVTQYKHVTVQRICLQRHVEPSPEAVCICQ